ncbi:MULTISPECIES: signal peptidase II [Thermodesulfovibrio]|jgi:signal peptidase II|uniref:Lipoprotein signal peptidase n=1 Tax=Thermodesulfovibrio yellowstonii (strain ATCC 51303 / DSM 11347 / YP87) TaxID=289376 RepID=LSPA_THEYD|nr:MULTISPECIES: signal peptidase II [Thermodesulfovibrio]B5YJT2.1 RecName: Full=Lipoprotein signal peptidase; AltName: Full=Prolipoprotein signal peptidase; AltName: Full=Signal peptidase II; Short=SPase II [Thermodesulfovibrio yellowstonii DSM 11347]ACI21609.1 signal peptidase II [Thermodesulfovibrio yellowstonii DSM 11347]
MSLKLYKTSISIFLILLIDQITKYLAIKFLSPDGIVKLLPFLNLVYVENTGTAFGMFKFLGSGFFIIIALVVTGFLVYMYFKDTQNWFIYSLIIAGALGNIIDRLIYGYVIDFIDLHLKNLHWPAFNVADSAISIGIVLFVYKNLKK